MEAKSETFAVKGTWVLVVEDGEPVLKHDHYVRIRGNTIEAVSPDAPSATETVIEHEQALILPGFVNLHSHCLNGALFRGIPDDAGFEEPWLARIIYQLLLPMAEITLQTLSPEEARSIVTLGMLDIMRGGTTTLVDQWNVRQEVYFDVAEELGIRAYGAPTIMSSSGVQIDDKGALNFEFKSNETALLDNVVAMHRRRDGSAGDRLRVMLGPHAPDTCSPELLRAIRETANRIGCPVTIHLSQTEEEVETVFQRHGMTPVEYLSSVGLLGRDLIAAHCVRVTDRDLDLMAEADISVANCVVSFARAGVNVPYSRTAGRGIRTGIGTDSHAMALIEEMRIAGFFSKLHEGSATAATAHELVRAATATGAAALRRNDLGRLAPGCKADLLVIDMARPHLQPVWDPVKNLIWKGSAADITEVIVDGKVVVKNGRSTLVDEKAVMRDASAAAAKVWRIAEQRGLLSRALCAGVRQV